MENARAEKQARESQSIINFEIVQAEQDLRRLNSKVLINFSFIYLIINFF